MFQTNWKGAQCSQVLAGTITCLVLELNLLQAGTGTGAAPETPSDLNAPVIILLRWNQNTHENSAVVVL